MDYKATVEAWASPDSVDWVTVRDALGQYLRTVVATFSMQNPQEEVYGILISRGQNWELSTYLNTERGYASMPARFRPMTRNSPERTDEEILAMLGRWYFEAWEFDLYEFKCAHEVGEVNEANYELFDRLSAVDSVDHDDLSNRFLHVCAGSVAALEQSPEIQVLRKTADFQIRFFDANCHEWETGPIMASARKEIDESQTH
ncbi:hypothetical protein FEM03_12765 [Phragmitibacter flavus]|uniref:DUF4303 domain-containing protein n=1 Tax=Phragmitibacter flavus TaxID=2576071 RepID=A0A5R8KE76_9BACT|nr:hypothetical protein [Phragmitibacter flavus]TLD70583.1 hypothetical protein FEM03_12765 [Phragmitibacter flavus]